MLLLEQKFANILDKLNLNPSKLAVAVSGGSDSMALLHLTAQWAKIHNIILECLVVDHGLRPSSLEEAHFVQNYCNKIIKVPCTILKWYPPSSLTNLQSKARAARYSLMQNYCLINQIKFLFIAHHLDDQAETFAIRLERGSGLDGLCGMFPISNYYNIFLVRPLLQFTKAELTVYLVKNKIQWIEDESNNNLRYKRSFYRNLFITIPLLKKRLALTCNHLQDVREALNFYLHQAFQAHVNISNLGYIEINKTAFNSPRAISTKLFVYCLMIVGGKIYKPRFANFFPLFERIQENLLMKVTLHGCVIINTKNSIIILRESAGISNLSFTLYEKITWDNRFIITSRSITPVQVVKIIPTQIKQFSNFIDIISNKLNLTKSIARQILLTLPFIKTLNSAELICPLLSSELPYLDLIFNGNEVLNCLVFLSEEDNYPIKELL